MISAESPGEESTSRGITPYPLASISGLMFNNVLSSSELLTLGFGDRCALPPYDPISIMLWTFHYRIHCRLEVKIHEEAVPH